MTMGRGGRFMTLMIMRIKLGGDRTSTETKTMTRNRIRVVMMSPFRPLAKRDRLRKSGVLRFAGDGKPLQNNLRAGQQALFLLAISVSRSKTSAPNSYCRFMLDYEFKKFHGL